MLKIEEQIIKHEGFSSVPYKCTAGKITIGYGRNLEDRGITEDEARILLRNDIAICEADLFKIFGKALYNLDDNRRYALIGMRYNLGATGFRRFKKLIAAVKCRNFYRAAREMKSSIWYSQVGERAVTLYNMMLLGADYEG